MCGIAGYIGSLKIDRVRVDECLGLMRRRGPDASGVYYHSFSPGQNVCLLHRRLSIIDLDERSNQPFKRGSKVLAYNGELYNYLELKLELGSKGHSFDTTSDTEVLLCILEELGKAGLEKCEGMWAFALYDEHDGSLCLARDRFGEKPLYIYEDESGLFFGSEIKFLSSLSGKNFNVNYNHLYRYLVNGYKSLYKEKETFFTEIRELPSSSIIVISGNGERHENVYWQPICQQDNTINYHDAVEGAREALIRSVKLRLRADLPLAFCMSGGVDSCSLISIAKRVFDYDVHGFTIINSDERYAEQEMVDYAVKELGIRHTSIPVDTTDFLSNLRKLIAYHDAPIYTISYYAHWLLMESIADHGYHISISGTAADELFSGYYDHYAMYLYEIRNEPNIYKSSLSDWNEHISPIVRNPYLKDPGVFIKRPSERRHIYLDADRFRSYLRVNYNEKFKEKLFCEDLLRNRMLNELFQEVVPVILHEDDINAMYFSIENRSPFLDRELFDFCCKIPTRFLTNKGFNKAILRDAMSEIAPQKITKNRRKVGFNAPIHSFLDVEDRDIRNYVLDGGVIFDHIKKDEIEKILSREYLTNSESKFLFNFLCSKMFLEEFE
ncbi:asparagine synthase (glutamine-hydrolyzing) [Thermodesulfobacteriota bacterium]